jgi:hypothetical protein
VADRIQLSRARGYRKPPGAVVVSRPSKWGNPFAIGERIDRDSPLWPYITLLVPGGAADLNDIVPLDPAWVVTAYGWWFIEQPPPDADRPGRTRREGSGLLVQNRPPVSRRLAP